MQDDSNRVWSKRLHFGAALQKNALAELREAISSALILRPDILAAELAESLVREQSLSLENDLCRTLFYRCVIAMLRHERKKARIRNKRQFVLPGFEHLPESIVTDGGKTVPLIDLNYSGVRSFYWSLTRPYARKMKGDPEIIDAKALLDKMRPYAKEKGITVRQVLLLDGGPTAAEQSA